MFRSVWDRIHSVYTGPVLNWNGMVPHRITFISGPIWYQIANPIRTGSTRSRVNTSLIRTNFVSDPNAPVPCKRCLNRIDSQCSAYWRAALYSRAALIEYSEYKILRLSKTRLDLECSSQAFNKHSPARILNKNDIPYLLCVFSVPTKHVF